MRLHHGTDAEYAGLPAARGGWTWWTEDAERAAEYGARVISRAMPSGELLRTTARDGREFLSDLADAGVDVAGIDDLMDEVASEPHMLLAGRQGAELARRVIAAGYVGVRHWESHYVAGEGVVVALAEAPLGAEEKT